MPPLAFMWTRLSRTSSSCDLQCLAEAFETERHPRRGERGAGGRGLGDEKKISKKEGGVAVAAATTSDASQCEGTAAL